MAKGQRRTHRTKKDFVLYARKGIKTSEPIATISVHSPEEAEKKGKNLLKVVGLEFSHIKEKGIIDGHNGIK